MIRKIQRRWFEVWGDEEAQNRILKYLLLLFGIFMTVQLGIICVLSLKKPLIIAVTSISTQVVDSSAPEANQILREVIRVVKQYLRARHTWDWVTIEARSKAAAAYVAPEYREKFFLNTQEQIRIAKEKQVSQKLFPEEPQIDLKEKKATVVADRILIVSGIRAAQAMTFELNFIFGERTDSNPEGIYVSSEKLLN